MITLQNISKTYAMGEVAVQALRGVSLEIAAGEFVAIMGPSGSGKSTLLHILGLLDTADDGAYQLLGHETTRLPDDALAALRNSSLGFIFQHFNLLPRANALENAMLPMLYAPGGQRQNHQRARELLAAVGLADRLGHQPNELSGGQQQRVAIARALIHNPRLILADEPTGNLDSASAAEIMAILKDLNRRGITIVMVTHENEIAAQAQRIIRMRDGLIQTDTATPHIQAPAPSAPPPPHPKRAEGGSLLGETSHNLHQAWRALLANKTRSALSLLGILIGVAAVIAMLAIGAGAREAISEQLASLGSNMLTLRSGARRVAGVAYEAGAVTRFKPQDIAEIRAAVPAVQRAGGIVQGRGQVTYGNKNWNTRIMGVDPDYAAMRASEPRSGRFFTAAETTRRARLAVLGQTLVRELFGEANPLGEYIKINKNNFLVIGILPEKGASGWQDQDDIILIPVSTAMFRLLGREYLDSIDIEIRSEQEIPSAQEEIKSLIQRLHRLPESQKDAINIRDVAEIKAMITETQRTLSWLLASIAAVSLLVGGIGIMNIMLVSVTERTREIGIRKAVGARHRDILLQFLTEALVVSLAGGGIGIMTGWFSSLLISHLAGWHSIVTASSILLAVGFSALVGIIFGLWPARKAARLNPIDALRYE